MKIKYKPKRIELGDLVCELEEIAKWLKKQNDLIRCLRCKRLVSREEAHETYSTGTVIRYMCQACQTENEN